MSNTLTRNFTKKWLLILEEYERVRNKTSKQFTTVKDLCEFFQIHRKDIRRYYERWVEASRTESALLPRKSGPKAGQLKVLSKEQERFIMKIRRRFDTSGPMMAQMIKGHFDIPPSVSTIYRTFNRYPLNEKRKKVIRRYVKEYPGELVHADTYHVDPTMVDDRKKYRIVGYIDDCTRLCYAELVDRGTAQETSKVFSRAYKWFNQHGIIPECVMTDNGCEFAGRTDASAKSHAFETTLSIFEVKQIKTPPYHPQSNGKIERFWRILQEECFSKIDRTLSKSDLETELKRYLYHYNYLRRHGSLEFVTPLDTLERIANLLPEL